MGKQEPDRDDVIGIAVKGGVWLQPATPSPWHGDLKSREEGGKKKRNLETP